MGDGGPAPAGRREASAVNDDELAEGIARHMWMWANGGDEGDFDHPEEFYMSFDGMVDLLRSAIAATRK